MRRGLLTVLTAGVLVLVTLALPASAWAGTYTWSQPQDFNATTPGSNPEHKFGAPSWSYMSSTGSLQFSPSFNSGLAGWTNNPSSPSTWIAVPPSRTALEMLPAPHGSVTLRWTSPFEESTTVMVSGNVMRGLGVCMEDVTLNGTAVGPTGMINSSIPVGPGGTVDLKVSDHSNPQALYSQMCDRANVSLQISAPGTAPQLKLTSPAQAGLVRTSTPTFSGVASTAFGATDQVTVRVYSGSSASGAPVQTLQTTRGSDGRYSVMATAPLADGVYTAQAEQDDLVGDRGFSSSHTFTINTVAPAIKLDALSSRPLHISTPTLTGQAERSAGASKEVGIGVYEGSDTSGRLVRILKTTAGSGGRFSVKIAPSLPDGRYTAVAAQQSNGIVGYSNPVTFRIKLHPPTVTLTMPASGQDVPQNRVSFSGAAGTSLGDSRYVKLTLYRGHAEHGRPLGSVTATAHRGKWSAKWPRKLRLGPYTVSAAQADDAGHVGRSRARTFVVVAPLEVIGPVVTLDRAGVARLSVSCLAPVGSTCKGNVAVLTVRRFTPSAGGPSGQVQVIFAYVSIRGGRTQTVSNQLGGDAARVLRRAAPLKVRVSAKLKVTDGLKVSTSVIRELRLARR